MNAVNLIPADRRKANLSVSASPATIGLIGGLVVVLIAAVLYVFAANDVKSRQSELARVTANAVSWQAVANSYTKYATAAQQRKQQIVDVRQLVSGRFPWSTLLSQIGGVMPREAALSSFQAQSPSADSTAASGSTATSSPTSATGSAVTIAGCAASQSAVAATMVALHRVHGVSSVSLQSSSDGSTSGSSSSSGSSSGSSGSSGQGGCPFQVNFQMTLVLGASAPSTSAASTSATQTPATTPAATATPAAATTTATTTPTGAAQ